MIITENLKQEYLEKELKKMQGYSIYLYGAGSFGKEICGFLEEHNIEIQGFIDQRADKIKEYCGYAVIGLDAPLSEDEKQAVLVLFAVVMSKSERRRVIESIRKSGFINVKEAQFYRSLQIIADDMPMMNLKEYYGLRLHRIQEAYASLADEKSKNIFNANILAHFTMDYRECEKWEDPMNQQYFPDDIKLQAGYGKFVDCGGFIGDTISNLLLKQKEVSSIVSFEPDAYNYNCLCQNNQGRNVEIICFPCAVSDKSGFERFDSARGSGKFSEHGSITIPTVALDEALNQYHPTFIKMDIEGAEIKALRGAKNTICLDVPDLAICVYHNINHLWDILLLLKSWELKYEFYLRSYNAYTMETVLYATALRERFAESDY